MYIRWSSNKAGLMNECNLRPSRYHEPTQSIMTSKILPLYINLFALMSPCWVTRKSSNLSYCHLTRACFESYQYPRLRNIKEIPTRWKWTFKGKLRCQNQIAVSSLFCLWLALFWKIFFQAAENPQNEKWCTLRNLKGLTLSRYLHTFEPEGEVFMDSNHPDPLFNIAVNINDSV